MNTLKEPQSKEEQELQTLSTLYIAQAIIDYAQQNHIPSSEVLYKAIFEDYPEDALVEFCYSLSYCIEQGYIQGLIPYNEDYDPAEPESNNNQKLSMENLDAGIDEFQIQRLTIHGQKLLAKPDSIEKLKVYFKKAKPYLKTFFSLVVTTAIPTIVNKGLGA